MLVDDLPYGSIGNYRILRKLGEGGMGVVYEALNDDLGRHVAIKVLNSEYARNSDAISRFHNEARSASRVDHPSIVQIFEFGQLPDGVPYLVMELLKGESLSKRLQLGLLPIGQALQIGWQVADVLAAVHRRNIVHRDLKPDNVMLVPEPVAPGGERVKLLDFGIAKVADSGLSKTKSSVVMGTPLYMSPEQCAGAGRVDDKSDVYSLGCVLYEMLAGRPPFLSDGGGEVLGMHLFKEPPPLRAFAPKVPEDVAVLVQGLLVKNKQTRLAMAHVVKELDALLKRYGTTEAAGALTLVDPGPTWPDATTEQPLKSSTLGRAASQLRLGGRRRWLSFVAVVGVIGIIAFLSLWQTKKTPMRVATSTPSTKQMVTLRIDTEPRGAEVVRADGKVVGVSPWQQQQERVLGELRLSLRLPGYVEQAVSLRTDEERTIHVVLRKLDVAANSPTRQVPDKTTARQPKLIPPKPPAPPPNKPATPRVRNVPLLD